ncbi:LAME_0C05270g1_1 [Lachancea meyersii CBS 8951]|uniref:LAME_0C05270g1_1 n=1 Tax=Lachancea meyersii CBS 8951 TaxID=1266667 RepID=A0A1G4J1F5_9SACH|nr:LAME_0C05270g1_1 [Lachancea meyersii CBS 8951]
MSVKEEIRGLLSEAAKFYAAKDYETSTNLYSEANAMYDASTGQSNADYLFLYGKSLYQLALSQSEVFGGEDDGQEEQQDEDTESGEDENDKDQQLYQFSETLAEGDGVEENGKEGENSGEEEGEVGEEGEGPEDEGDSQTNDQTQTSDFENAWEVLELARAHYEKQAQDQEILEKLSETYSILGEISLETENFPQAAHDLTRCLELRKKAYSGEDPTHRLIIESHYKLFLALELDPAQSAQSQEQLEAAVQLLDARIKDKKGEKDDEGLLEELKLKLKELKSSAQSLEALKQASVAQIKEALTGTTNSNKPAAVNDLTSMVKKRKPKQDRDQSSKKHKL